MQGKILLAVLVAASLQAVKGQWDPNFVGNRTTIVHLFEWKWNDIAEECERFLGPYGYGGVQTSPVNENVIIFEETVKRAWYERYQPVSYKLETRSGTEEEFKSMVDRCNKVGVRIYVDMVINHMSGDQGAGYGTGGTFFNSSSLDYPGVPYSYLDFNGPAECHTESGNIESYQDVNQVRNCRLLGLKDLNQGKEWVRDRIKDFFNKLIAFGVAGFRIDASKHMWPGDMEIFLKSINNLPTEHGFPVGARPYIFQEVIDDGGEPISSWHYLHIGGVTEFKASSKIGNVFRKNGERASYLVNWGEGWDFIPSTNALVFVDNHDNQRGHGSGAGSVITFRDSRIYKMATAFFLAWPYGVTRVMSSYYWEQDFDHEGKDKNDWVGPPHDEQYNIVSPIINPDMTCGNGWICEHRWRQIYNMNRFRNAVKGTDVDRDSWWTNEGNQIGFARGDRGFLAINNDDYVLDHTFQTHLPDGIYCDVISGNLEKGSCTGKFITVADGGKIRVILSHTEEDPIVAIHVDAKL